MATRKVAIVGGNRTPFARSNGPYSKATNADLLTAAVQGLVDRYDLQGKLLGEVSSGTVLKDPRVPTMTREVVLSTNLDARTPAYDVAQACGTGLQTITQTANKIALGQIESGIASGVDTTSDAPILIGDDLRNLLLDINRAKTPADRLKLAAKLRPGMINLAFPANAEARTGLSMGEHQAITTYEWGITREAQDELAALSHQNMARSYERGFQDDLITPYLGLSRDQNLRPSSTVTALAKLKPVFGKQYGDAATMTAANSTPMTDGASAVLLASEDWAKDNGLQTLAYFVDGETAGVDYVHGDKKEDGLLLGGVYAVPRLLARNGLTLDDFDFIEIHEAFAGTVLSTIKAWEDADFGKRRLGLKGAFGSVDRSKLNVNGSSLAAGHPFAATGGRIVAALAKMLHENGGGRGLISICAAGGMGVTAILEA